MFQSGKGFRTTFKQIGPLLDNLFQLLLPNGQYCFVILGHRTQIYCKRIWIKVAHLRLMSMLEPNRVSMIHLCWYMLAEATHDQT